MKICYIANASQVHTRRWARYFAGRGHEVHLLSPVQSGEEDIGSAKFHYLKKFPLRLRYLSFAVNLVLYIIQIRRLIKLIKPDILHAHYITECGFWGALSGFHPFVLSVWGSDVLVDPQRSRIYRFFVNHAIKRADSIMVASQCINQYMRQELNVPLNKLKILPWGIDTDLFKKGYEDETKELKRNLSIEKAGFIVLSPRSIGELYGTESIVKSIPHVINKHPDTYFVFFKGHSDPTYEARIRNLIDNLGINHNVRLVPRLLDESELPAYYNVSDALVSIPRTDQFSSCIQEGMACGVIPIIGKQTLEVYKTYLRAGKNGFLVDRDNPEEIADTIIYCIEHPELKDIFYRANRKIIMDRCDWNKNALEIERAYYSMIEGKK